MKENFILNACLTMEIISVYENSFPNTPFLCVPATKSTICPDFDAWISLHSRNMPRDAAHHPALVCVGSAPLSCVQTRAKALHGKKGESHLVRLVVLERDIPSVLLRTGRPRAGRRQEVGGGA